MWSDVVKTFLVLCAAGSLLIGSPDTTRADLIRDSAGFFSPEALAKADAQLAELKQARGKEVRIETLDTVPDGKADEVARMDSAARAKHFETLARDRATAQKARGVYILITRHPGHVQIEVDKQTRNQGFGPTDQISLRDTLLAGFRTKQYDKALQEGVETLSQTLRGLKPSTERPAKMPAAHRERSAAEHSSTPANTPQAPERGMGWMGWIIAAVGVVLAIRLLSGLFSGMGGGSSVPGQGGGMFGSLMTGLFGAFVGNWLFHSFFDNPAHGGHSDTFGSDEHSHGRDDAAGAGDDWQGTGGDFGNDSGSGDFGGGDFGGGDFGGGDAGGGDF